MATGRQIQGFIVDTGLLGAAEFFPDGVRPVWCSHDKAARVWDIATGQQLAIVPGHGDLLITAVAFPADGRTVLTASADGFVETTPADLVELMRTVCGRVLRDLTAEELAIYELDEGTSSCSGFSDVRP